MTGSLLELVATGSEDQYFIGNPKHSFFKNVFYKQNNFAIERIITRNRDSEKINKDIPRTFNFYIDPLKGDLLDSMYLRISLPKIYNRKELRFQWVKNLGSILIDEIKMIINDKVIEKLDTNMIYIENVLNLKTKQKNIYNELTGNTGKFNDPYKNTFTNHYYATTLEQPVSDTNTLLSYSKNFNNLYNIPANELYIPLPFYFNRISELQLPLCKLLNSKIQIQITLKPFNQLYILLENKEIEILNNLFKYKHYNLDTNMDITNDLLNFNPTLISYRFFLQDSIKKEIINNVNLKQLITVNIKKNHLSNNTKNIHIKLKNIKKGNIKEIYLLSQRNDVSQRNDWSNFTIYDDVRYINNNFNVYYTYYKELSNKQYNKDKLYLKTIQDSYNEILTIFYSLEQANIKVIYTYNNNVQIVDYSNITPNNIQDKNILDDLQLLSPVILDSHNYYHYYYYFIKPEIQSSVSIKKTQFIYRYFNTEHRKFNSISNKRYLPSLELFGNLLILNFNIPKNSESILSGDISVRYNNLLDYSEILNSISFWNYRGISEHPLIDKNNIHYFNSLNIIEKYNVMIDGNPLNTELSFPFNHYHSLIDTIGVSNIPGVIYIPFSLHKDTYQPTGHLNINNINNIEYHITLKDNNLDAKHYNFNTFSYTVKYYLLTFDNYNAYLLE